MVSRAWKKKDERTDLTEKRVERSRQSANLFSRPSLPRFFLLGPGREFLLSGPSKQLVSTSGKGVLKRL